MITHTKTATGYDLKVRGNIFARVEVELDGSFSVVDGEAFHEAGPVNARTMAALKLTLEPHVPEIMSKPVSPEKRYTYKHVAGGMSHARGQMALSEARKIWWERRADSAWINAFVIRRGVELAARWPWGDKAREWLEINPTLGTYDREEYYRRIERQDGPQPAWTY